MKRTAKTVLRIIASTVLFLLIFSCSKPAPPRTDIVLGTVCTINLFNKGTEKRYDELFSRLSEIELLMSANRADSSIGKINAAAGMHPVNTDRETITVLSAALDFAERSNGLFDPTIGPLVKLWDIGGENEAVPTPEAIEKARSAINWRNVTIDRETETVFLEKEGMRLDLGAIAKGYAADELAGIINSWHITSAMIDLGGNILAIGSKTPENPWHIGIRNPEVSGGNPVASLYVRNKAMVTSGINERFFMENGIRYHHILDPLSGYPSNTDILSVSILSQNSMEADALSTTLFLMGTEKALAFIETIPGADAIIIDKARRIHTSTGLKDKVSIRDNRYTRAAD